MTYYAVFRARSQTMRCYDYMIQNGIEARVVNTPREAGYGCGISVAVSPQYYAQARTVVSRFSWTAFAGWWVSSGAAATKI